VTTAPVDAGAEPYVVRWPLTARTLLPELLVPVFLVAWLVLLPRIGGHRPATFFWVFAVLVVILRVNQLRTGRIALEVGPVGIRIGQTPTLYSGRPVAVPWRSITEVVVLPPRVLSPADLGRSVSSIGVRLRPDAPLPAGVRALVREPGGVGPLVTRPVRGWVLDRNRLVAAVSAYAPGVRVVEQPA
jgi:hypothetical protein